MENPLPVAPPHVYLMINEVVFKSNNWGGGYLVLALGGAGRAAFRPFVIVLLSNKLFTLCGWLF